jgi:MarR family transcriptional regulator, organic hydroperoxide resistance regulator
MFQYGNIFDLVFENLKKFIYPEEWILLDLDFSKSELFVLLLVEKQGEIIMSKIADSMNISMSTANGIVERLVKNGYVDRDRSDADRRIVVVCMTDKGKRVVDEFKNLISEYIKLIYQELDDDERKLIGKVFHKIIHILDKKTRELQDDMPEGQLKRIVID